MTLFICICNANTIAVQAKKNFSFNKAYNYQNNLINFINS